MAPTGFLVGLRVSAASFEQLAPALVGLSRGQMPLRALELRATGDGGEVTALATLPSAAFALALAPKLAALLGAGLLERVEVGAASDAERGRYLAQLKGLPIGFVAPVPSAVERAVEGMRQALLHPPALRLDYASEALFAADWAQHVAQGALPLKAAPPAQAEFKVSIALPGLEFAALSARPVVREGAPGWLTLEPSSELIAWVERYGREQRQGRRSPSAFTDRRSHDRFETVLEVGFANFPELAAEYASNISRGGLFIRCAVPPPMRAVVELKLTLPLGKQVVLEAEVVHRVDAEQAAARGTPAGVGVQFKASAQEQLSPIEALLERFATRQPKVLVVDGDGAFSGRLAAALLGRGVEVELARTGTEGLLRLIDGFFSLDLLVVAAALPGLDGAGLVQRVRQQGGESGLRVVLLSGEPLEGRKPPAGVDALLWRLEPLPKLVEQLLRELGLATG